MLLYTFLSLLILFSPVILCSQCVRYYPLNIPGIVNITEAGGIGDGSFDNTDIILSILTRNQSTGSPSFGIPLVILFPPGTYIVSDTIVWYFYGKGTDYAVGSCVSLRGSGVDVTTIKLKDNQSGFQDKSNPKAIIQTKGDPTTGDNQSFQEYIRDLTVDVGVGNPGAIGINYLSNNLGAIKDVKIISNDQGHAGISMLRPWTGPCMIKRTTIIGFDYGVLYALAEYSVTFEQITLQNQNIAGFNVTDENISIRNLISIQSKAPAIYTAGRAFVFLLDSSLSGSSSTSSAIVHKGSRFYLRNVKSSGYLSLFSYGSTPTIVPGDSLVGEYLYPNDSNHIKLFPSSGDGRVFLSLPIRETPLPYWSSNASEWALIPGGLYGSQTYYLDQAFSTGQPIVYFPRAQTRITGNITIPRHVRALIGFETLFNIEQPVPPALYLSIDGSADDPPLVFDNILWHGEGGIIHNSSRTVVLLHSSIPNYYPQKGAGDFYGDDVGFSSIMNFSEPQNVWLRQFNIELHSTKVNNTAANLWILGIKTEHSGTIISTSKGARTELYGNLIYQTDSAAEFIDESAFEVVDSSATYGWGYSVYNGIFFPFLLTETQNGVINSQVPSGLSSRIISSSFASNWKTGVKSGCLDCSLAYNPPSYPAGVCDNDIFNYNGVPSTDTPLTLITVSPTSQPPVTTTHAPVTTTHAPVTTTHAPVTTTHAPLTTTHAPVTTTHAPATTTHAPVTTTHAPLTTTHAPVTTTHAPATTTHAPVTTTHAPATTTHAPVTTTHAPLTTTHAPLTTTHAPVTTTHAPTSTSSCLTGCTCVDIGSPAISGSQTLNSDGSWTVLGSGNDIWNTEDQFHYIYSSVTTFPTSLSVLVSNVKNTNSWAKAGVMFRAGTNANEVYYAVEVTAGEGIVVQYRKSAGSSAIEAAQISGKAPIYVKATQNAGSYSAYTSADGNTWTLIHNSVMTLSATSLVGAAVTSHNTTALCSASFTLISSSQEDDISLASNSKGSSHSTLPAYAIALIVVGCLVLFVAAVILTIYYVNKRQQRAPRYIDTESTTRAFSQL